MVLAAMLILPSLSSVVTHHAVPNLPDSSTVIQAEKQLEQVNPSQKSRSTALLVLQGDRPLTKTQLAYFSRAVMTIAAHKTSYNLSSIVDEAMFMFFLLIALGVDYSIFLMSRFDEEFSRRSSAGPAMQAALRAMGIVIFSAAMIMAGTFGSLTASGMTTLLEIGTGIIIGLLLYAVVMLGFIVPAFATIAGNGHHWPFARHTTESEKQA
jgi:uncharacterized membrane protein YdfJ with MMPL/SSD domain